MRHVEKFKDGDILHCVDQNVIVNFLSWSLRCFSLLNFINSQLVILESREDNSLSEKKGLVSKLFMLTLYCSRRKWFVRISLCRVACCRLFWRFLLPHQSITCLIYRRCKMRSGRQLKAIKKFTINFRLNSEKLTHLDGLKNNRMSRILSAIRAESNFVLDDDIVEEENHVSHQPDADVGLLRLKGELLSHHLNI